MVSYLLALALPLIASAYPQPLQNSPLQPRADDPRFTNWLAPGPNDVRSPCPGLNSLANHGFIHHDGRNMTIPHLVAGLAAGMNVGADFTTAIGSFGLLSAPLIQTVNPLTAYFNLDQLDQHNFPIEHDGSLSRNDAFFGNDYSFNQNKFNELLSFFQGSATTSIKTAAAGKYSRVQTQRKLNPTFTYGPREFVLSYGETALYLQTMSDPTSGVARVDYVKSLFEQERLPYNLGWRPSAAPITLVTLGNMILTQLFPASPEPLPEALSVLTQGTINDVFAGIDPVTGLVFNATNLVGGVVSGLAKGLAVGKA